MIDVMVVIYSLVVLSSLTVMGIWHHLVRGAWVYYRAGVGVMSLLGIAAALCLFNVIRIKFGAPYNLIYVYALLTSMLFLNIVYLGVVILSSVKKAKKPDENV